MHFRQIMFSIAHIARPELYVAMRKDRVETWMKHENGLVEIADNIDNDFPNIRELLREGSDSFNFQLLDTLEATPVKGLMCRGGFESGAQAPFSQELVESLLKTA